MPNMESDAIATDSVKQGAMNMERIYVSEDSWMYPYQGTPMGNPYISPI